MLFRVTFGGGNIGMFSMQWVSNKIEADTREEAVALAKLERDEAGFASYKRLVSVEELFRFAVTFRGKADKRKRETFFIVAKDERQAVSYLHHNDSVQRFAGYVSALTINKRENGKIVKVQHPAIVKVERS